MAVIETGFSERAAERRAVEEDRAKAAAFVVRRVREVRVRGDEFDDADAYHLGLAIKAGKHAE